MGIKGPLTTPVGGGIRSLNVTLRQVLDLYSCIRPVRWIEGVPSPMREPERLDVIIFRENTEGLYAGIEWASGTPEAEKVRAFLVEELGANIREKSGIGIKPISAFGKDRPTASHQMRARANAAPMTPANTGMSPHDEPSLAKGIRTKRPSTEAHIILINSMI